MKEGFEEEEGNESYRNWNTEKRGKSHAVLYSVLVTDLEANESKISLIDFYRSLLDRD